MNASIEKPRVILVLTESCAPEQLWRAVTEVTQDHPGEMLAVFIDDERWQRVASLPFTREFSRTGGSEKFTARRAKQLFAEAVRRLRREVDRLAAEAGSIVAYETLPGSDEERATRLLGGARQLLIAPPEFRDMPIYARLTHLEVDIRVVESPATTAQTNRR